MSTVLKRFVSKALHRLRWPAAVAIVALSAGMLVQTHAAAAGSRESATQTGSQQSEVRQAIQLKVRGLNVSQALTQLRQGGLNDPASVAGVLIAADYPPQSVEAELISAFSLRRSEAVGHVRDALAEQARLAGTAALRRSLCYTQQGTLLQCPLPGTDEPRSGDPVVDRLQGRLRVLESAAHDTILRLSLQLAAVPFALQAGDAATLGGLPPAAFAPAGGDTGSQQVPCTFEMRIRRAMQSFPISAHCLPVRRIDTEAVSRDADMVIAADGRPVIAYSHDGIEIVFCTDAQCSTHTTRQLSSDAARWISLALPADGLPIVSYYAIASESLRIAKCLNPDCSQVSVHVVDDSGRSGEHSTIAIGSDGLPFIAYHQTSNGSRLRVAHCHDGACLKSTTTTHFSAPGTGTWLSMVIGSDGNPFVVFRNPSQERLMALHCANPRCLQGDVREVAHQPGFETAVALGADGFPIVVLFGMAAAQSMERLALVTCLDVGCVSKSSLKGIAAGNPNDHYLNTRGRGPAITVGSDGKPLVSYASGDGGLELTQCQDTACEQRLRTRLTEVPAGPFMHLDSTSIRIGVDSVPIVSASWGRGITIARCPFC